ncbi:MAG: translation initiation factor IF-2 [Oscillatoriales cyanobacterium CG2_30_44_21]|nr:MAG: translation initiation factor IF-2 [Oscillatoriales cyanobacterium CG2_30_44_21]
MGFADYAIAEIAEDYKLTLEFVFDLCDRLGIAYQDAETKLALEDAKAVIMASEAQNSHTNSPNLDKLR